MPSIEREAPGPRSQGLTGAEQAIADSHTSIEPFAEGARCPAEQGPHDDLPAGVVPPGPFYGGPAPEKTPGDKLRPRAHRELLPDGPSASFTPPPVGGEVRVVNEKTGGEKGSKLARFDLLPWAELEKVAEHYGRGAAKYEDRNWEKGYDWSLSYASLVRHLVAFWNGENIDPEMGSEHLAAVVFHALALMFFAEHHPDLDNSPGAQQRASGWR